MRRSLSRVLFVTLLVTACKSKDSGVPLELSSQEETVTRSNSMVQDDPPPPEEEDTPDDGAESGGAGTAMALEEGKAGKSITSTADISSGFDDMSMYSRQEAVESARSAGTLGYGQSGFGPGGGGTGMIGNGRYGTIGKGSGTGSGYGVGAGRGGMRARQAGIDTSAGETYKDYGTNAWTVAEKDSLSTFAADVDTASYTILRRKLVEGTLPPTASVRVEEMVNYFKYAYAAPQGGLPFSVTTNIAPSPFGSKRHILRVGVSTKSLAVSERKQANLVFLVDVSGSMSSPDKLALAKRSLRILVDNLKDGDTVALVTYAGTTRTVLSPTGLAYKPRILSAIEELGAGGSTAMGDGIELAYEQAMKGLRPNAVSRVIVLSDGDANVGNTTHQQILARIKGKVKEGVTLSTIGFGMGNYRDELMEQLANKGNGNNFYIDGLSAAKRVFQEQLGATLEVVAKDVKLQVDFDKQRVKQYRLIGYENRDVRDEDFRNDKVDAGEIGAGHQVTALYEVELADNWAAKAEPLATVRVRHKEPRGTAATEAAFPMALTSMAASFAQAPADMRFAFAVAAFGDVMRGGEDAKGWDLQAIRALAKGAVGTSAERAELVDLIDRAITLRGRQARVP